MDSASDNSRRQGTTIGEQTIGEQTIGGQTIGEQTIGGQAIGGQATQLPSVVANIGQYSNEPPPYTEEPLPLPANSGIQQSRDSQATPSITEQRFAQPYRSTSNASVFNDNPSQPLLHGNSPGYSDFGAIVVQPGPTRVLVPAAGGVGGGDAAGTELANEHDAKVDRCATYCLACCVYWFFCWLLGLIAFVIAVSADGSPERIRQELRVSERVSLAGVAIGIVAIAAWLVIHFAVL